ncbi:Yip1 family protein [Reinekea blandensis]|uniref:Amino acid transporter n=1 Tax=Reinekea blandensis MED297 TaxID=314283 RepID=A4BBL4_9GAMM|nr:Yip1 family protein [Reinekea blandensis]EAR10349.1 Amino acid transporter [Reinekea sp. MED297] [Reinekea blandensis MED297]
MILDHVWGIFTHPDDEWETIRSEPNTIGRHYLTHALILAAIPAVCAYIGATQVGWSIGSDDTVHRLTSESALMLCLLFYGAMITGVVILGKFIDFLSATYQEDDHTPRGVALATYTTAPLFICGIIALYPVLWLDMIIGLIAVAYSVYLLYEGVPILMSIPKDKGFIFASAIVTVGLVMFVGLLAITVIVWAVGVGPVYIPV